jgi:putative spermidine/putrescine transport system ATP-binding protein
VDEVEHVVFDGVTKQYGAATALSEMSLGIRKGEFFSLLGPSGCGKTTTLRILAGFVAASTGSVTIGGRDVTGTPPERRGIGLVPQDYAIFPHLTVFENVAFGLKVRKVPKDEIRRRVDASLAQVGLSEHAGKHRPVRRTAAARGPGQGARHRTRSAAARRTALGARPQTP